MANTTLGIELIIQLCRMQIQRERERLKMTPKMAGALAALKQLRSAGDDVADKITKRIANETMPALLKAAEGADGSIDSMHTIIDDIDEFTAALKSTNGGDPLDDSKTPSDGGGKTAETTEQLRSSDVAALKVVGQ